jgi:exonuclease SbcC
MLKRLTLIDFMAHGRTTFDLAPGLNVLTGPNNTGKSAVVEALRCLAQNPAPRHCIRHGASEARVVAELDDGTLVAWVRRPKYALYELTRPGACEPEVFAKFGRTPPEEILAVLAINPVTLESGEVVDVHIGNQREPVFLLNQPGSVVAGFFAASTEAAHLIAMQNLLTERARKAKTEKRRLETQLASLAAAIDRLAPLPDLELRLLTAAEQEADLAARERETAALVDTLTVRARLQARLEALLRAKTIFAPLAAPPPLAPTAPLAAVVAQGETLGRDVRLATRRGQALARLAAPPALGDTASLARHAAGLSRARTMLSDAARKAGALAPLAPPPVPADVAALDMLAANLARLRDATQGLARKNRALVRLVPPPTPVDARPLAELAAALEAARAARLGARAECDRKSRALADLADRIAARLAELGACPLCGGRLSAADFLGDRHRHDMGGAS